MAYTKDEKQLYNLIKAEGIEEHNEIPQQAELIAREYLYHTRREKFYKRREERNDVDGYGHKILI